MGKQVNFFMDAQDEREFANVIVGGENVVLVPQVSDSLPFPEFRRLEEANGPNHRKQILLIWNKAISDKLTTQQCAPNIFAADITSSDSIIEFSRCFCQNNTLVGGRLWAEMYALDEATQQLVHKGKEFEQWYDSLARWIRRHYKREKYGMCIGPSAEQAYKRGEIQLADHMADHGPINVR